MTAAHHKARKPTLRDKLRQAIAARQVVKVRRAFTDKSFSGLPLEAGRHLAAFQILEDFFLDGHAILRLRDVRSIRNGRWERAEERLLRGAGRFPDGAPLPLDLSSWRALAEGLRRRGTLAAFMHEATPGAEDTFWVGRVLDAGQRELLVQHFDTFGVGSPSPRPIRYAELTRVDLGTDYLGVYERHLPAPPRRKESAGGGSEQVQADADPIALLDWAMRQRRLVKIRRAAYDEEMTGILVARSDELVLLRATVDFRVDGLEILRVRDITKVTSGEIEHYRTRLLAAEGRIPDGPPPAQPALGSVRAALESLRDRLLIIEREATGDFFLGRLVQLKRRAALGYFARFRLRWMDEPEEIPYDEITRIEVGSDYLGVFEPQLPSLPERSRGSRRDPR